MASITSYNEWGEARGEGTQIESAVARERRRRAQRLRGRGPARRVHREDACARDRLSGEQAAARRRRGGRRRPET
jgi:hypothetical protein